MLKQQRGAVRSVMDMSLFVMLLLSGLLCSASGRWREYNYINQNMSWTEAQSYCRKWFTDLATVDSMDDVNRMINTVNDGYSGSVWIGLKRATQSRWGWSMGNDTVTKYSNWASANASSGVGCAFNNNTKWYTTSCSTKFNFACYNESNKFIISTMFENWTDAQSYCRENYIDLSTVESSTDQQALYDLGEVWIGLFFDSWQWSDQWSLFFRNWAAGQPFNSSGSGDCVAMSTNDSGKWSHDSCDLKRPFICHGRPLPFFRPYRYINTTMSWPVAQSYCRAKFYDLATVDYMNGVNRMINTVNDGYSGSVWIGLNRATQSRWGWSMGDDTLTQYSAWALGQTLAEPCVYFDSGFWYDYSCLTQLHFVCFDDSIGYIKVQSPRTWADAQSYCRQYHTDLATIKSLAEQNEVLAVVGDGGSYWIGLFLDSWHWSDQWSLFFRNWDAGHPSQTSGSSDCVAMSTTASGKWVDDSCDVKHPFICEGSPKLYLRLYHFVNEGMTWRDAQKYCRARFTEMATVDTMNDVRTLMNTVDSGYNGSMWIGLFRISPARWVWSTENTVLSQYSHWSPGEPNGNWECVKSCNGSWYDVDCALTLPFVCFNDSTGYVMINTPLTWRDAQSYCRQHHTDLASVSSPEQQRLIEDESSSVWIGLFLDSWFWSDWRSFFFRNWAAGYPSQTSGSGNCAAMSTADSGKWIHNSCDQKLPFFCYGVDDKLVKRQIVRLNLSCYGNCNLNDTSLQTVILNEINKKLQSLAPGRTFRVKWGKE